MALSQPDDQSQPHINEIGSFLVATAMVLRETVTRYEKTVAQVTERIMRPGQTDRELIVTLQDFDRLQQEFVTLAEVLTQAAAKSGDSWQRVEGGGHPAADAIATISIADLKERLMRRLGLSILDMSEEELAEEVVF
jgi:hypothetical protein